MKKIDGDTWRREARAIAEENHLHNFRSRRGVIPYEDSALWPGFVPLALYDNNPFASDADDRMRDGLFAGIRADAEELGLLFLAEGAFGEDEDMPSYTRALVFGVPRALDYETAERSFVEAAEAWIDEILAEMAEDRWTWDGWLREDAARR